MQTYHPPCPSVYDYIQKLPWYPAGHIAPPPYCTEIVSRSFDTGRSRLKIFHHRMLRDRTLLSPSSASSPPPPLHVIILSSCLSTKGQDLRYLSFSPFSSFFLSSSTTFPFSSNLLLPSFFSPRSRGRSADQVPFEPKKIPSIYPPPLLPSLILLSNAEDRYVPQGFGANLPTPGREIPGKKAAAGVARHGKRKVAVAATPDGLIPLPGSPFFFFHRWTERARNCSRVCGTRMIGG